MRIKNLIKAGNRIKKAIQKKEGIILYGDNDLDGVASVIILKEVIKNLNGEVTTIYFPDREKEGYGINERALEYLKKFSPALFITLDCGISNFKEVDLAKKMGFEVMIIDHHEVLEKLPAAKIIVDPKQKGDKYPFKYLSTAGIVFKLAELLLKNKMTEGLRRNFLELVALATLADLMPLEEENRAMVDEGLISLENSWRPGLRAFLNISEIKNQVSNRLLAQKIISALGTSEKKDNLPESFLLLTSSDPQEAEILAKDLLERSYQKHRRIQEITNEVEERFLKKLKEPIVFEGDPSWPLVLLGSVASRICQIYKKPIFLFKKMEKESRGTVRTPPGQNAVEMMKNCSRFLVTYGGHPQAAGFTIKNENLEKFKTCLIKSYAN